MLIWHIFKAQICVSCRNVNVYTSVCLWQKSTTSHLEMIKFSIILCILFSWIYSEPIFAVGYNEVNGYSFDSDFIICNTKNMTNFKLINGKKKKTNISVNFTCFKKGKSTYIQTHSLNWIKRIKKLNKYLLKFDHREDKISRTSLYAK